MSMTSSLLEEMCLDAMPVQIQEALSASGGDANQAADALLGKHNLYKKKKLYHNQLISICGMEFF